MPTTRDRLFEKLKIATSSKDPTLPEDNAFALLGIDESLSDANVLAHAQRACIDCQAILEKYKHIDLPLAGALKQAVADARNQLGDPARLADHRRQLRQKRLAVLKTDAVKLHKTAATEVQATTFLEQTAGELGFPPDQVRQAVAECIRNIATERGAWARPAAMSVPTAFGPGPISSSQARLLGKLGIACGSEDPTLPYDNYFAMLAIDEACDDPARMARALNERLSQLKQYGHLNRGEQGRLNQLVQQACNTIQDAAARQTHRWDLWRMRIDALLVKHAQSLHDGGLSESAARKVLLNKISSLGFSPGDGSRAVDEVIARLAPWPLGAPSVPQPEPQPQPQPGPFPTQPQPPFERFKRPPWWFWGAYGSFIGLYFLSPDAMWTLGVVGAVTGVWIGLWNRRWLYLCWGVGCIVVTGTVSEAIPRIQYDLRSAAARTAAKSHASAVMSANMGKSINVTGFWAGTLTLQNAAQSLYMYLDLKQRGQRVSGVAGVAGDANASKPLVMAKVSGTVQGDSFQFRDTGFVGKASPASNGLRFLKEGTLKYQPVQPGILSGNCNVQGTQVLGTIRLAKYAGAAVTRDEQWRWHTGDIVTLTPEQTLIVNNAVDGHYLIVDGEYRTSWLSGDSERLHLSPDAQRLTGSNQKGEYVSAIRSLNK